jgi:hypothetical protein
MGGEFYFHFLSLYYKMPMMFLGAVGDFWLVISTVVSRNMEKNKCDVMTSLL